MKFSATCHLPALRFHAKRPRAADIEAAGRCAESFTDPVAFEAHMKAVHGRSPYRAPVIRPVAHKAPPVPSERVRAANLAGLVERFAGELEVTELDEPVVLEAPASELAA